MHLARADGGLWLVLGVIWWALFRSGRGTGARNRFWKGARLDWSALVFLFAGYLLVMGPWMARNLAVTGTPLSPGAGRALWITEYDELYAYPTSELTPGRWLGTGSGLLAARFEALKGNLLTALAVQGQIFLAPLILAGAWRLRADRRVGLGLLAWAATGLVMTLVFPFQGARGGFFHSGAALQPFLWALAPVGLQVVIDFGAQRRGWQPKQALPVLASGLVMLAALLTAAVWLPRVAAGASAGGASVGGAWGSSHQIYSQVERILQTHGARSGEAVLVNNPPGYFVTSSRPSLAIPNGDAQLAQEVARRYGGVYLILEKDHPQALQGLYHRPEDGSGWHYLLTTMGVHIFRLENTDRQAGD
jgi:hypothetical protein